VLTLAGAWRVSTNRSLPPPRGSRGRSRMRAEGARGWFAPFALLGCGPFQVAYQQQKQVIRLLDETSAHPFISILWLN
jgi:hypothetical protein